MVVLDSRSFLIHISMDVDIDPNLAPQGAEHLSQGRKPLVGCRHLDNQALKGRNRVDVSPFQGSMNLGPPGSRG
jgi:hypothetical protein